MRRISFIFFFLLLILVGCNPTGEKKSLCANGQTFDPATRGCGGRTTSITVNTGGPVNTLTSDTLTEDIAKVVYLTYTDPDGDKATTCSVSSVVNVSVGACSCTNGICSVTVTPDADENASSNTFNQGFSLLYTVTANAQTSTATWASLTVNAVDDAPVITSLSPVAITLTEDNGVLVTANWTDIDGGAHTYATLASSNLTITDFGCGTGTTGTCLFYIVGASNFSGSASVSFQIASLSGVLYTYSSVQTLSGAFVSANDVPVGTLTSASFTEDTESIITLTYTDVEGDIADTGTGGCAIASTTNMAITTACSCVAGVCTVGLTPGTNVYTPTGGAIGFSYTITTNVGTSTSTAVSLTYPSNLTVTGVDDAPVGTTTAAAITEDTTTNITLGYTDPDGDTATICSISNYVNGSGTCSCSSGVCTLAFVPATNVASPTAVSFNYTLTTGTLSFASAQAVTVNVSAANDNPTITTATTSLTSNMNTTIYQALTIDEGGGADEDSQIITGAGITFTSSNTTLVPTANISVVLADTTTAWADTTLVSANSIQAYLKIIPSSGVYGTSTVTMTVSDGVGGTASQTFAVTVNPVYAVHNGWTNIKALGNKTDTNGSVLESKYVAIYWEDFTLYGAAINSSSAYNVYRSTSASIDFKTPLNTSSIPSTQKYYIDTDSTLTAGTTYYYAVRPIDSVYSKPIAPVKVTDTTTVADTSAANAYGNLTIVMPANNMALVHRWAVNKEVCQKMGKTAPTLGVSVSSINYDPDQNFRCQYVGPGNINSGGVGYYDLSKNLHVDRFELGCNYSTTDCTSNGCIGYGSPSTTGCEGNTCIPSTASVTTPVLYYDRSTGSCYYNTSPLSTTWTAVSDMAISVMDDVDFKPAHLPPLTNITAAQAQSICDNRSAGTADRLIRRAEFVAASAWDTSLADNSVTSRETGSSLGTTSACNSSSLSGLSISSDTSFPTSDTDTLPSTQSTTHRTLITGSTTTANCVSRYGISDLVGNVREWNSDTINYATNMSASASAISTVDTSFTTQFQEAVSTNVFGFNSSMYGAYSSSGNLTEWQYKNKNFNGNYFNMAYGIPSATNSAISMSLAIDTGITAAQLHEDFVAINASTLSTSAIGITTSGGSFEDGTQAGRYAIEFLPSTTKDSKTGFRCVIEY